MQADRESNRHAVIIEYAKLASVYDARWSFYVRATTDATVARLPQSLGNLLDIGCGTGALLFRLSHEFPEANLSGVDASSEMLAMARTRLRPQVELKEGWAEKLPFDDARFDTVVSCNMFHYVRHPHDALVEMLRVLRPGGTMMITDWCDDYLSCRLCDWYLRWFDPSHFHMYSVRRCRQLLVTAGAQQITIDKYKISWLWGLMTAMATKSVP